MQSASDTISDTERGFIDKEVQQLKAEIDRNAQSTEYNGVKLLNGEGTQAEIQVGIHNSPMADRFTYDIAQSNITTAALGVGAVSAADKASAQTSLDSVDNAIKVLSENRASLGALQNRLQSSINSIGVYSENLAQAKSRVADVDIASETAELTKSNILAQAGTAVLSQANQNPQMALKLLG